MKFNFRILVLLVILFAFISINYAISATGLLTQTLYLVPPILAVLVGFCAFKMYGFQNNTGKIFFLLTMGFLFWTIGEILWYVFKNFWGIDPFPSAADIFFLLAYPLLFGGLFLGFRFAEVEISQIKKSSLALYTALTVILALFVAYFGIYKAYDAQAGLFENIIAIAYGVGDLFLIIISMFAFAVSDVYKGGRLASFWALIAICFFFFLAADILFAIFRQSYLADFEPIVYIDLIWLLGYLVFSYAMLDNYFALSALGEKIKKSLGAAKQS